MSDTVDPTFRSDRVSGPIDLAFAGASFLRRDGRVWTTDKDGPIMGLLAAELTARTSRDPGDYYRVLAHELGESVSGSMRRLPRSRRPCSAASRRAISC